MNKVVFLDTINHNLNSAVRLAEADYRTVNEALKKYYNYKSGPKAEVNAEVDMKIEAMMGGLQYMDVFTQRVDHLVTTHQRMAVNDLDQEFKESFFQLHIFQSLTIELDLIRSITMVKSLLSDVKEYLVVSGSPEHELEGVFPNLKVIKEILMSAIVSLKEAGGETHDLSIPPLTKDQVMILSSLYTMESERMVLSWFLNSMPDGTWNDLMTCYEEEFTNIKEENTELF